MTKQKEDKQKKKGLGPVAIRHRKVLKTLTENIGNSRKTMVKAMTDAGYSKSYAEAGQIKSGKTWQKLTEELLGDDLLSEVHHSLLRFKKVEYMQFSCDATEDDIYEIISEAGGIVKKIIHSVGAIHCYFFKADGRVQKDAVELAYKIRGKMSPEKVEIEQTGFKAMSDQELADYIKKAKSKFNKTD